MGLFLEVILTTVVGAAVGHGAPSFIQRSNTSMSLADNFSFGGISRTLCVRLIASKSNDLSGLPGATAGPESPPFNAASRVSRRKPPSALSGPWQEAHR